MMILNVRFNLFETFEQTILMMIFLALRDLFFWHRIHPGKSYLYFFAREFFRSGRAIVLINLLRKLKDIYLRKWLFLPTLKKNDVLKMRKDSH